MIESYIAVLVLAVLLVGVIIKHSCNATRSRRNIDRSLRTIKNWY